MQTHILTTCTSDYILFESGSLCRYCKWLLNGHVRQLYRGVLLICMIVGQGPIAFAVGAGGGCLDIFTLLYLLSILSPFLWWTARYGLKYCLKGPLNPKQPTNQPTNQPTILRRKQHILRDWCVLYQIFMRTVGF